MNPWKALKAWWHRRQAERGRRIRAELILRRSNPPSVRRAINFSSRPWECWATNDDMVPATIVGRGASMHDAVLDWHDRAVAHRQAIARAIAGRMYARPHARTYAQRGRNE